MSPPGDERPQLRIRRELTLDDDPLRLRIAEAARAAVDRLERDGVAERLGEPLKRREEMGVRVACQRL